MRNIIILCAALLCICTDARAQDAGRDWNQAHDPYVGGVGLSAGPSSGSGLSIRWPALPQTMFTATGAAWGESGEIRWNLGLEGHYILRQVGRTRLYVAGSVAHYVLDDDSDWNAGAGVGVEYLLWPRWALKADFDFVWLGGKEAVYPLPQGGLVFYW